MIKVLVVDDSAVMVRLLSEIINSDPALYVVGTASNGYDAVQKTRFLAPDVITMDVNMPRMDGIKAVEYIMSTIPAPIVMISSFTREGTAATIEALNLGAIDFISKPLGYASLDMQQLATEILAKIKLASKIRVLPRVHRSERVLPHLTALKNKETWGRKDVNGPCDYQKVVAIGCSTGGPQALDEILQYFPSDFPAPILIVQHMPEKFTERLAELLNHHTVLHVVEAKEGMSIQKGHVYIAPGAYHMKVRLNRTIALFQGDGSSSTPRPSVDILMQSVAQIYGKHAIGVILTGMGNDGVAGMNAIKDAKGLTIAQDEETSLVFGMPKTAIESGCVDSIVPLEMVAEEIMHMVQIEDSYIR